MAEPTVWGFTATAGVSTTFTIEGTNVYGVVIDGAVTPKIIPIAPNAHLLLTATKTIPELVAGMLAWIKPRADVRDAPGGIPQTTIDNSRTPSLTVTS